LQGILTCFGKYNATILISYWCRDFVVTFIQNLLIPLHILQF
jgi:hypothetical protein